MWGRLKDWLRKSKTDSWLHLKPDVIKQAVGDAVSHASSATVPITDYDKTASGGMSALMNRIIGGGLFVVS